MKTSHILTFGLAMLTTCLSAFEAKAVDTRYKFDSNSLLSTGKWVRIEVPETGIYEITYDQLREMGFSDPSLVGVYGHGGSQLEFNFTSSSGTTRYFQDNPDQIPVLHTGDKLVFYGVGTETIKPTSMNSGKNIKFNRDARNIYSDVACYMLSDSNPLISMDTQTISSASIKDRSLGFTYEYHENDITHGGGGTGQIFYGEPLATGCPLEFSFSYPYASKDTESFVSACFAIQQNTSASMTITLNGNAKSFSATSPSASSLVNFSYDTPGMMTVDSNNIGTGNLSFDINNFSGKLLALDWWIATCPLNIELMAADAGFTQQFFVFPSSKNTNWRFRLPDNAQAWYVNNKSYPVSLDVRSDGYAYGVSGTATDEVVVFNPAMQQKQIETWTPIANQNLHALQTEGADLLIFSTDYMLPYARRIAQIHEQYDGIKVAVVTPRELYDEFNTGTTDPLVYRAMAKMLYQNEERPLKNVLFIGKMTGDIRNIRQAPGFSEALIAYQENVTNPSTTATCIMDYYGVMTDYVSFTNNLATAPISIGVGLLPISTAEEASNAVAKIEEYVTRQDYSNIVNEILLISCDGDSYLHDSQAVEYTNLIQDIQNTEFGSQFSNHHIRFEDLDRPIRKQQFRDAYERGKAFGLYFGHGIDYGIGVTPHSLTVNDMASLNNKELGFQFIAACDLCSPDQGRQGVGDVGVLRAKRGFIATIAGTRSVMSSDNESLARTFMKKLFYDGSNNLRTVPATIGEAYALAKDNEKSPSQLAFFLFGDPAIHLPLALGKVDVQVSGDNAHPEDIIKVTGKVLGSDSQVDTEYNGYATVKLMKPAVRLELPVIDSSTQLPIASDITDQRLATVKAEVKNGEFSVLIPVPENAIEFMSSEFETTSLPIYVGTYNPVTRIGCSGTGQLAMAVDGSQRNEDALTDDLSPEVDWSYDNVTRTIQITASDNVALIPGIGEGSGVCLAIDGQQYRLDSDESEGVSTSFYEATLSAAHFQPGKHEGSIFAKDLAGNVSEVKKVEFEVKNINPFQLSTESLFAIDEIEFNLLGNETNETCVLIMTDNDGNIVYSEEISGNMFKCDISDLEAGIYRAAVRHDSAKGSQLYSNWVEFSVID